MWWFTIDQRLFDVTLAPDDGKEIRAHKLILLAGSQFFREEQSYHNTMVGLLIFSKIHKCSMYKMWW